MEGTKNKNEEKLKDMSWPRSQSDASQQDTEKQLK